MAQIKLACPYCKTMIQVPDTAAGKKVQCPKAECKKQFVVPAAVAGGSSSGASSSGGVEGTGVVVVEQRQRRQGVGACRRCRPRPPSVRRAGRICSKGPSPAWIAASSSQATPRPPSRKARPTCAPTRPAASPIPPANATASAAAARCPSPAAPCCTIAIASKNSSKWAASAPSTWPSTPRPTTARSPSRT